MPATEGASEGLTHDELVKAYEDLVKGYRTLKARASLLDAALLRMARAATNSEDAALDAVMLAIEEARKPKGSGTDG